MSRFLRHCERSVTSLDGIWDFAYLGDVNPDEVDLTQIQYKDRMAVPGCFDATPLFAGKRGLAAYRIRAAGGAGGALPAGISIGASLVPDICQWEKSARPRGRVYPFSGRSAGAGSRRSGGGGAGGQPL